MAGQPQNMTSVVCVLVLLWTLQSVSARRGGGGGIIGVRRAGHRGGDVSKNCETYYINGESKFHSCRYHEFCCGDCEHRSCCSESSKKFTLEEQDKCYNSEEDWMSRWQVIGGIIAGIFILMLRIFCLVKVTSSFPGDAPVATTTDTTDVAAQYPQNPTATQHNPATQPYSGYPQNPTSTQQYPDYQPGNPQLGYGTPAPYGGQPMVSAPQPGPPSAAFGPPPPYQDVVGGSPVFNYSGAGFAPGQQSYPIQHPVHAGYQNRPASPATAPTASADFLTQTAYNPNYATPPP